MTVGQLNEHLQSFDPNAKAVLLESADDGRYWYAEIRFGCTESLSRVEADERHELVGLWVDECHVGGYEPAKLSEPHAVVIL
jgi:hypothetical protein